VCRLSVSGRENVRECERASVEGRVRLRLSLRSMIECAPVARALTLTAIEPPSTGGEPSSGVESDSGVAEPHTDNAEGIPGSCSFVRTRDHYTNTHAHTLAQTLVQMNRELNG